MSSSTLKALVDEMEAALEELLDSEQERLETERDFLLAVLDGTAEGMEVEALSTEVTTDYLNQLLSDYMPIEED